MQDLSHLNSEQKEAVLFGDGPLLIVAGAGTGKTTVIVERIKHLILEKQISPSSILGLTFTEKSATEMEERVDTALPYGYTQMWLLTFHAFCERILRAEGLHLGLTTSFQLTTEAEALQFLRKHVYKFNLKYFRPLGNPHKFLSGMLQHFSRLKDDDITPEEYLKFAQSLETNAETTPDEVEKIQELAQAFVTYETLKQEEGVMDFSDLISHTLRLFRTKPHLLKQYQNQFKYILVDEFQDTNYAQNELAILLTGEKQNITVVGDDDQAIYRWRGAALSNIIQFREHFPKTTVITLNKNYRSTEEILTKSHQMIQFNNPNRLEIQEKINKQLISMREKKGEPIEFLFAQRVEKEAELVTDKIKELLSKKNLSYKDIAILVRANDHALPFIRSLEYANIPFQFLGPGQLFQQEEIKDLIAYLYVLLSLDDSASLYRLITQPHFTISPRDISVILNFGKKQNLTLYETMERIDDLFIGTETKAKIKEIVTLIQSHLALVPRESAGKILYDFLQKSNQMQTLISPTNEEEMRKAQNIAKFFEKITQYEQTHEDSTVFAITDWITLSRELGESPLASSTDWTTNDAVNILTVHSSKGLEFPAVFITNLVNQRFPSRDRKDPIPVHNDILKEKVVDTDPLSEERRLFYVAMTRAKDYLYLSASLFYGEGKRERKLSPFIQETLGKAVIDQVLTKQQAKSGVEQLSFLDKFQTFTPPSKSNTDSLITEVNYLSYSMIQTFENCPLHYKLRYLLKIPTEQSAPMSFGSSIHAALQGYYQAKMGQMELPDLDSLVKAHWIKIGYQSKSHEEHAFTHAKELISSYIEKHVKESNPIALETPFLFSLGNLKIGGRVDRIDKTPDGKLLIIDYKTGASLPTEKEIATDLQLTLYALAACEVHDAIFPRSCEEVVLELHYLEQDAILRTTRTPEQLEEAREYLKQKAEEISRSDYVCTVINCKQCEYALLCTSQKQY